MEWVYRAIARKVQTTRWWWTASCILRRPTTSLRSTQLRGVHSVYSHRPAPTRVCCGSVNRSLGILGDTLFMGTVDARLIAIDARMAVPSGTCWSNRAGLWDHPRPLS
jgi:hypothetical protein